MVKVALLDDYQNIAVSMADWSRLPEGSEVQAFQDHLFDESALALRLEPFDVIVAMRERTPFRRSLVEKLPNLKLLITTGARNASFDMPALKEWGVTVAGTRGAGNPTAELCWGLILSLVRHIPAEDRAIREGKWQLQIGPGLGGKTLGLVGLGNLGAAVAKVGLAFNMNVIAWSMNLTGERAAEVGAKKVSKEELFEQSDVISIHYVLSDRSRGLVGAEDLARMKSTAYLVNTSRGPIVDEEALARVLEEKKIAGAGLDVFEVEPLPAGHPFRRLENTVVTPHIGYVTSDSYRVYYDDAIEDILTFLEGNPVRTI